MATFAWLSLLFLAFSPLKEVLCKECTNIPSSSHTLRQAALSSPKLSAESMDLYPYYNPYGASQSAENPRSHSDQSALYASSLVSEENPFADRVFSGFLQLKSVPQESAEAMDSAKDSFLYGGAEAMNSAKYSFLYGGNAQLEAISEANVMSMELDKYQFAGRKVMRPYAYADKVASESDEDLAQKRPFLQEVSLHDVFLDPDSMQGIAQQTNLEYLLMLDVDNLVWSFRNLSGLSAAGSPYGGWESPTSELRGHFVGHYMSATAHMWASTHNKTLYDKMTMVVDALSECQQKIGNGYLSAFPSEFFDRFEAIEPVWAPYYTIHKIMAGLLDQYSFAGNTKALKMAEDMADYFDHRVSKVIDLYTIERHWESLNEETGGMNDVLYRLYTLTKDPKYLKLAHLFDKPCFLGLLAVQADSLSGFHANTHIPVVIGAQMRFEITSDRLYKDMSSFFTDIVSTSHSYPTGGTSAGEFWTDPLHLGDTLSTTETEESCTTYNMLKVARHLFRWTKQMKYADYYERTLTNGVLSIQRGQEPGVMIYMLPMGKGQSKAISYHGWGTKFESFWCCYGTGIESFSKLGDSIYFEEARGENASLYIIQLVSSSLAWKSIGLLLQQRVEALSSSNPILHMSFEFSEINNTLRGPNTDMGTSATLQIRIPFWVESSSANASLNNEKLLVPLTPGEFLQVQHTWQVGDKLELFLNPLLRVEKVKDSRDTYSSLYAIFFGPYLLAGKSDGDWDITGVDLQSLTKWVTPIEDKDRKMLYSFTQESTSGQGVVFLTHQHSGLSMGRCPLEGTNEAMRATFKLVDPVATKLMSEDCLDALLKGMGRIVKGLLKHKSKGSSNKDVVGELVAIEQFDQPGSFLMHEDDARVKFARSNVRQHDGRVCENSNRVFRVVPGLHAPKDYVSFEAVSRPGCFLYTDHDDVRAIVKLGCIASHKDTRFRKAASFLIHPQPLASYPSISFTAKGTNKEYPVFPLIGFKDETYTVFFNITR